MLNAVCVRIMVQDDKLHYCLFYDTTGVGLSSDWLSYMKEPVQAHAYNFLPGYFASDQEALLHSGVSESDQVAQSRGHWEPQPAIAYLATHLREWAHSGHDSHSHPAPINRGLW